uniref:MAM domain-containing protein n=1 Tax=Setaria digitata TaxID=48799 RepID=A0A915PNL1_9BILA
MSTGFYPFFSVISVVIFHSITEAETQGTNLSCNFDDGTLCGWRSDSDLWLIGANISINSFQFIPHFSDTAEGHLISAEVEKYDECEGMLSFRYWKSNNISKLDVCITQQNTFVCMYTAPDNEISKEFQWNKQTINFPGNLSTPFKIVFRARNIHTPSDIVAIDEIEYNINPAKAFASLIPVKQTNTISEKILLGKQTIITSCFAVQCTFIVSPCAWTLEAPWHHLKGNIALDSEGEGLAKSGFFQVPTDAFFEMDVWISDNAVLTILENLGKKLMIWRREGLYDEDGWRRLRIPVQARKQPFQLILKGTVPSNNFITISNTKLVDATGNEIGCHVNPLLESIILHPNNTERLTAFQQLDINQMAPTVKILKDNGNESLRSSTSKLIETNEIPFTAPMISSIYALPPKLRTREMWKPLSLNDKIKEVSENQSRFQPRITNDPNEQQQNKSPLISFRQNGLDAKSNTSIQFSQNNPSAEMKELNKLLSKIAGQPLLEMQLRQLAQRFRFTHIDAEQGLRMLRNFMDSKGFQFKTREPSTGVEEKRSEKPKPIIPVNAPSYFTSMSPRGSQLSSLLSFLPNELRKQFASESKAQHLSDEIVKRLSTIISAPRSNIDVQLPLTRNHLDFIVHNAAAATVTPLD